MARRPKVISTGIPSVDKAIMAANPPTATSILDSVRLLENVVLVDGVTKRIAHGLKRKLRGWFVVRTNAGEALGSLYDEQSSHTDTDTFLYLRADGYAPTLSLVVF